LFYTFSSLDFCIQVKKNCSLPISALVKATFEKTKTWFVEQVFKIDTMLHANHYYSEDITTLLRKNQQDSSMCFVERFNAKFFEFDVQELATPSMVGDLNHIQLD